MTRRTIISTGRESKSRPRASPPMIASCSTGAWTRIKIGVAQIEPDGSLPLEMRRGQRALHYHLYAVAPLVYLAEFGEDNGLNLYAEHNYALKKLAVLSTQGLEDNSFFTRMQGSRRIRPRALPRRKKSVGRGSMFHDFPIRRSRNCSQRRRR